MRANVIPKALLASVTAMSFLGGAQAAPATQGLSCTALKSQVQQSKVRFFRHSGRNVRFVGNESFCGDSSILRWRIVKARDGRCSLKSCQPVTSRGS